MAHEGREIRSRVRKDIEAFLKSLGSTASEVQVFLVLYRKKRYLSVREIVEESGLSEKGIRIALKRLEERGLVRSKEKDGKKYWRAVSAKELVEMWKKKVEESLAHLFRRP